MKSSVETLPNFSPLISRREAAYIRANMETLPKIIGGQ